MKKVLFSFLAIGCTSLAVNAQNVNIPDANFKAYLVGSASINTNADSEIQVSEASAYTGMIVCSGMGISDMTGLESFTAISQLHCNGNNLTSLDVSSNTNITQLTCASNQIDALDISLNTAITLFDCGTNSLTSLNVANGNNASFTSFYALNNANLVCIEVDNAVYSTTNWTDIDAGASFSENCSCTVNIPDVDFKAYLVGNALINTNADAEIQCSEASAFTGEIDCFGQGAISDLTGLEAFTSLTELRCDNLALTSLDVTQNTALTLLLCYNNQLTSLDVTQNTSLEGLVAFSNSLTTLDVSQNTVLTSLSCNGNSLTSLDVSQNLVLSSLECQDNAITDLDLSVHPDLIGLSCQNNALTSLNMANGNNLNIATANFNASNNPNLTCIQVDDVAYSTTNWTSVDATANFSINCGVGINELEETTMSVYPNPASSQITIETEEKIESVMIFDVSGSLIQTVTTSTFSVENLLTGVYLANVKTSKGISRVRFVKN